MIRCEKICPPQPEPSLPEGRETAIALGFFDGIHRGHQDVIEAAASQAANGLIPCVFTFSIQKDAPAAKRGQGLIQDSAIKEYLLERMGIQYLFCPSFETMKNLTPEQFVRDLLIGSYRARHLYCGENFHFGKGAAGNVQLLRELCAPYGVEVTPLPLVTDGGETISSTRIRKCIREGRMSEANRLMNHPYTLIGPVIHGRQLGHKLGCPTANQRFPQQQVVPRNGVYATIALVDGKKYIGATNVGRKPTVGSDEILAESFLLDFDRTIYGETVEVRFYEFLRPEQKFDSLEELQASIQRDAGRAKEICQKYL